jgi:two-component system response regulator MprA
VVGDAADESAKPASSPPASPPQPGAVTNGSGPRILFVDDDPVIRLLAAKLLREAGYTVEVAVDGKEALDRVRSGAAVSLVVTDLHMPRFGGAELLTELRDSGESAGIPVIVLTGSDENDQESSLMDAGADDYIRKPIDPVRFISRIRAALRRANL